MYIVTKSGSQSFFIQKSTVCNTISCIIWHIKIYQENVYSILIKLIKINISININIIKVIKQQKNDSNYIMFKVSVSCYNNFQIMEFR